MNDDREYDDILGEDIIEEVDDDDGMDEEIAEVGMSAFHLNDDCLVPNVFDMHDYTVFMNTICSRG